MTKPPTIRGRWDQFVLESVSSDSEVLSLLILKRAFVAGFANGVDLLDDRIVGHEQEDGYKLIFRDLCQELLEESNDTTRRLLKEMGRKQEETGS
jgi:hypothetical protein